MKTLANCTPREFFAQTNKIRKVAKDWMDKTKVLDIRLRAPEFKPEITPAEKMAAISRKKQVLCVTHLPQLAAMADTHFSVEKSERDGRTYTQVCQLDRTKRREELARLTGGAHVSEVMLSGAEELLCAAETFKEGLVNG